VETGIRAGFHWRIRQSQIRRGPVDGDAMQALILAGGEGTRLRPLTSTTPKPVIPLVGRPFIGYMIEWLRGHGVDDVILSCGFMAEGVRAVLGDGADLGVRLRYVEEPEPLGTGGALKFAEELLDERFFMLNGDVLTDMDLTAQLGQHERTGARATIALIPVEDPSAYGLVRRAGDLSVTEFLEKPSADEIDTNLINAGAYILERTVLDGMPAAGTKVSIERQVFPALVGEGLYGYESAGYWLDIGTPDRYLHGTFDILEGVVSTETGRRLAEAELALTEGAAIEGEIVAPALVGPGSRISAGAVIGARTVLGANVEVGEDARIEDSVVLSGSRIGAGTTVSASIVGAGVMVGDRCRIEGGVMLGDSVSIGSENALACGARIFPGVELPPGAIRF
jgi:mannose-1-phosphate guanylyltransferase